MKKIVKREVWASEIVEFLGLKLDMPDFLLLRPCSPKCFEANSITYVPDDQIGIIEKEQNNILLLVSEKHNIDNPNVVKVNNPQLEFYRIVNEFFMDDVLIQKPTNSYIAQDVMISRGVSIGDNCYIGSGVKIGANSVIGRNVIIGANTVIGKDCYVKENSVIGSEGYQFIETKTGYLNKPCLGRIVVKDNVLIGAGTTIEIPEFDITEINSYAKIDDLVNIGSTCSIGEKVLIAAGSIICHRVKIGSKSQIGAGTRIREDINIGENVIVGIGSVVINDLDSSKTYAGNPAKQI